MTLDAHRRGGDSFESLGRDRFLTLAALDDHGSSDDRKDLHRRDDRALFLDLLDPPFWDVVVRPPPGVVPTPIDAKVICHPVEVGD